MDNKDTLSPCKAPVILIVDDTPITLQILSSILSKEGYQIETALSGRQALDMVGIISPDLIIMDVVMPEMDGYEVCRTLKDSPATRDIPIIFLTVKNETGDILKGFETGAVDYVTKPFNAAELLTRVRTHLELKKKRDNEKDLISRLTASLMERDRAEEDLRKSEGRYRNIFENALMGIYQSIPEGRYITANFAFARMLGYDSPDELISSITNIPQQVYVNPDDRLHAIRLLEGNDSATVEVQIKRRDGTTGWIANNVRVVRDDDGNVLYYEGVVQDITENKRMEEELQKAFEELEQRILRRTNELGEANVALRVLLSHRTEDQKNLEERLRSNINELVIPFVKTLKSCYQNDRSLSYINVLESNLRDILSPFLSSLSSKYKKLTPKEIQIIGMIKDGMESKEIAEVLGVATSTVSSHRESIRKKLGLSTGRANLRSFLISIS